METKSKLFGIFLKFQQLIKCESLKFQVGGKPIGKLKEGIIKVFNQQIV